MTDHQKKNWKSYCSEPLELVENYQQAEAEKVVNWQIHHRLEIQPDGTRVSAKELVNQGKYWNRPASELVFMRCEEHTSLHNKCRTFSEETRKKLSEARKGRTLSEDTRKKLSEALSGDNNPMYGKHHSSETRLKMSAALKGMTLSAETRQKLSEALSGDNNPMYGKHHSAETRQKIAEARKGMTLSEETRKKLSEALKGRHWWNDGISNKRSKECPGPEWKRGSLKNTGQV